MTQVQLASAKQTLADAIEAWYMDLPYLGPGGFRLMARAAVSVLEGIDDAQTWLQAEGMMSEADE